MLRQCVAQTRVGIASSSLAGQVYDLHLHFLREILLTLAISVFSQQNAHRPASLAGSVIFDLPIIIEVGGVI